VTAKARQLKFFALVSSRRKIRSGITNLEHRSNLLFVAGNNRSVRTRRLYYPLPSANHSALHGAASFHAMRDRLAQFIDTTECRA